MDPLNILSRPARIVLLLVLLAMGAVTVFVFVEATLQADAQAPLVFLAMAIYAGLAYGLVALVDTAVRAVIRRRSRNR